MENDVRYNMTDLEADLKIAQARIKELEAKLAGMAEVVRCEKCRHSDMIGYTRYCFHWDRNTDNDGFCHEGV